MVHTDLVVVSRPFVTTITIVDQCSLLESWQNVALAVYLLIMSKEIGQLDVTKTFKLILLCMPGEGSSIERQ